MAGQASIELRNIHKRFGASYALKGVDFSCDAGEIHAIAGENGAGKSTLMKVLVGALSPDEGECRVMGKPVRFSHPSDAHPYGISIVYQELNLLADRSVAENIFVGRELSRFGHLDKRRMRRHCLELMNRLSLDIDPDDRVGDLAVAQQQMVEIAKAVGFHAKILVLDEPTATLAADDSVILFELIRRLKEDGLAIVYISHRMPELFALSDRITVLKDGLVAHSARTDETSPEEVVEAMIGRKVENYYPATAEPSDIGEIVFEIEGGRSGKLRDVSFHARAGEILGVFGLKGSGRTELAYAIWGMPGMSAGSVTIRGEKKDLSSTQTAIASGIGFVPEDRKEEGLALDQPILDNALLARRSMSPWHALVSREARAPLESVLETVDLRSLDRSLHAGSLSGGNQQKIVLAKWLLTEPGILVLAEPTRGVDVSAKAAIYHLLRDLTRQGKTVIVMSSELQEIVGLCDRTYVMRDHQITREFHRGASETEILVEAGGRVAQ